MSAAFKIGVLLYCHERKLPHPGIVVLDSPLLSYREPLHSKYGALSPDEEMIVKSGLAEQFYKFLIEKSSVAQFVILEIKSLQYRYRLRHSLRYLLVGIDDRACDKDSSDALTRTERRVRF